MIQYQLDLTDGGLEVSKGLFFRYRKHGRALQLSQNRASARSRWNGSRKQTYRKPAIL